MPTTLGRRDGKSEARNTANRIRSQAGRVPIAAASLSRPIIKSWADHGSMARILRRAWPAGVKPIAKHAQEKRRNACPRVERASFLAAFRRFFIYCQNADE